jgi:hypothetical protein
VERARAARPAVAEHLADFPAVRAAVGESITRRYRTLLRAGPAYD